MDGLGLCPYDPRHNSTAVFVGELQIPIYFRLFIFGRNISRENVPPCEMYVGVRSWKNFLNVYRVIGLDRRFCFCEMINTDYFTWNLFNKSCTLELAQELFARVFIFVPRVKFLYENY